VKFVEEGVLKMEIDVEPGYEHDARYDEDKLEGEPALYAHGGDRWF
jgi:hypothetical protein